MGIRRPGSQGLGYVVPQSDGYVAQAHRGCRGGLLLATLVAFSLLATPAICAAADLPRVESESASNVSETDAMLEARILSDQLDAIEYQFKVVEAPCLVNPTTCSTVPSFSGGPFYSVFPGVILPVGERGREWQFLQEPLVSVDLNDFGLILEPGREYHYAVFAWNSANEINSGPDQTFTTPGTSAPVLEPKPPDRRYARCVAKARKVFAAARQRADGAPELRRAHRRKHRELARCRR